MTHEQLNNGVNTILKKANDPSTWVDRGLLGGIGYGAKNITEGNTLKGIAQIIGSPIGALKGGMNSATTASEDYSRAISQLSQGQGLHALTNGAKGLYNTTLGPIQAALIGRELPSQKQLKRHNNPKLEQL